MKKSVIVLAIVLIFILSNSSFAYHFGGSYFTNPKKVRPYYEPKTVQEITSLEDTLGRPDLIVTDIHIPEEIPKYTLLKDLSLEIKNIGKGKAEGMIQVEVEIQAANLPSCKRKYNAGGGFGNSDPRQTTHTKLLRYTVLYPEQTHTVYLQIPTQVGTSLAPSCDSLPFANDFTIKATVNPIGGSIGQSRKPKGRITESDMSNNLFEKIIKVLDNPSTQTVQIKLSPGTTAFTIPLKTQITANQFITKTGCDLHYLPKESVKSGVGEKTLNIKSMLRLSPEDLLVPGVAYFADCSYPTYVEITGSDPGPFNLELIPKALNVIPTRAAMQGLRLYDLYNGCSRTYGREISTEFYSYVGGMNTRSGKLMAEITPPYTQLIPGLVYFMLCGSDYGGIWDPEGTDKEFKGQSRAERPASDPYRQQSFHGQTARGSTYRYASRAGTGTRLNSYHFTSSYYTR